MLIYKTNYKQLLILSTKEKYVLLSNLALNALGKYEDTLVYNPVQEFTRKAELIQLLGAKGIVVDWTIKQMKEEVELVKYSNLSSKPM